MEKLLIVAITLAVVLAVGIVNANQKMTKNNFCNNECNNNICRGVENNTALPNEADCRQFFICADGHPIPNECPPGQWFNSNTSHCDNTTNPECNGVGFECPPDGIHFFPHEEYCDKFIMCFAGFPILRHCADGLYFDRELGACNFPEYAECMLEVCPRNDDPTNITFIPSDVDCEKFYICYNGSPLEFWCAPGIHWNQATQQCDFPENANCTIDQQPDLPSCPEPHEIDCDEDGIYFVPHPNSCEHYFICSSGESFVFNCAPGFWFDPINQWCDIPENCECAPTPTTTPPPCTTCAPRVEDEENEILVDAE